MFMFSSMVMMSSNVGLTYYCVHVQQSMDVLKCRNDILLCSWSAVMMWGLTSSDVGRTYYCVHVQQHGDDALRCRADILLCSCSTVMMMFSDVRLTYNCVHVQHAVMVTMWCLMSSDDGITYQRQTIRGCTSAGVYVPCNYSVRVTVGDSGLSCRGLCDAFRALIVDFKL